MLDIYNQSMKKFYSHIFGLFNATFFYMQCKSSSFQNYFQMIVHGFDLSMNVFFNFLYIVNEKGKIVMYGCGCFQEHLKAV
jgi:hypothetical protein